MNDILGAVGWDGIDVHVDTKDGGHVMSSANFSTRNSVMDYDYVGKEISTFNPIDATLHFEMNELFKVEEELMVLECDFYYSNFGFRKGSDIILLPRPNSL